ncbi:MAG: FGGY family carbohydrate kinase, partial [Planctomycetota bacterium]|jgi:sugar (pentulose or hexulose) kinase
MDYSTATTFHLQEQSTNKYHKPFLEKLEITEEKLSALVKSGVKAGQLTDSAVRETGLSADTEVITGCFDHPAAARSVGILKPGSLMLSCGTSWVGFFPENDRQKIVEAEILCDPFLSQNDGPWGAIFSVPKIGQTIDWYIDNLIAGGAENKYEIFSQLAEEADCGAGGLKINLNDEPAPVAAEKKNISRAVMEGAVELLNDFLEDLQRKGFSFTEAVMVGGPTRSRIWTEILEQRTGLKLNIGSPSAGAKGAALLAGIGIGLYKDEKEAFAKAGEKYGA